MRDLRACVSVMVAMLAALLMLVPATGRAGWPNDPAVNVPVADGAGEQAAGFSLADGEGGVWIPWIHGPYGEYRIFLQRFSATGERRWGEGASPSTSHGSQWSPRLVADGGGGLFVAWVETRDSTYEIRLQKLDASGARTWGDSGIVVRAGHTGVDGGLVACADGAGGLVLAWMEAHGAQTDIVAQRVSGTGSLRWAAAGVTICSDPASQWWPSLVADGTGGAIVGWVDARVPGSTDVYAQRVNGSGVTQWTANGVGLCTDPGDEWIPFLVSDGAGGCFAFWDDRRETDENFRAQHVTSAGAALWAANGVVVAAAAGTQRPFGATSDGAGGAIVAWLDERFGTSTEVAFAQRLSAAGTSLWTSGGVQLGAGAGSDWTGGVAPDGAGGAVVTWSNWRVGVGRDLYAQRVNAAGAPQWMAGGIPLCTAVGDQNFPTPVTDGQGGAFVSWDDSRNWSTTAPDVYAQHVDRWGCLGPQASITRVADWPGDEGGFVALQFDRSPLDFVPGGEVARYRLWRQVPQAAAFARIAGGASARALAAPGELEAGELLEWAAGTGVSYWEYMGEQVAGGQAHYAVGIATACDSVGGSNPATTFMVEARNAAGSKWWYSDPASGYSVDNLAPPAPTPFTGAYVAGTATLDWGASTAVDFSTYRLYRAHVPDFPVTPATFLAATTATHYADVAGAPYWYKVTAVDVHGNEGPARYLQPTGTVDVDAPAGPPAFALRVAGPLPARGDARFALEVPADAPLAVELLDAQGRLVRTLASGPHAAGVHALAWDGRDAGGRAVRPGLYFARLRWPAGTQVRKVPLAR